MNNIISKWMKSGLVGIAGVAFLAGMTCSSANAQQGQALYEGKPADQSGLKVGSWGGGIAKEVSKGTYGGSRAVEVTPGGLYAGGRIDFQSPLDVTSDFQNPNAYLQIIVKFGADQPGAAAGAMPGMGALFGGGRANTRNAAGVFGGMPGMPTMPGAGGMMGGAAAGTSQPIPSKRLQVIIEFDTGDIAECQVNLSSFNARDDGWMDVSYPLSVVKSGLDMGSFKIKRIAVCGDGTEIFRIGEIRTEVESGALTADAGEDKEVARNDRVSFVGYSNPGASAVTYSWDFDASDGIQQEGLGEIVYHRFRNAGREKEPFVKYTVTLTVSDSFGIKKPATSSIVVQVNN